MLENTQIIILAGGIGKRMGGDIPKVLTLLNKKTLISHLVDSIKKCNFELKPVVVVGFKGDLVKKELSETAVYANQAQQLGTGHAVMLSKDAVCPLSKNIIVLYGDMPNIKSETIKKLLELHESKSGVMTMMTIKVPNFDGEHSGFKGFGRIIRDDKGDIKKIVEVRDATQEEQSITELNPSLFCFDSNWLWENISKLGNNNSQKEYYLTDLAGIAIEQNKKLASLQVDPMECIGVNTKEELKMAEGIISNSTLIKYI